MSGLITQDLTTRAAVEAIIPDWQRLRALQPEWLMTVAPETLFFEAGLEGAEGIRVVASYRGGEVVGLAPLVLRSTPLEYMAGYRTLARVPMRSAELLGGTLLSSDPGADEVLLGEVLRSCRHEQLIRLRTVAAESSLGKLMTNAPSLRQHAWFYDDSGPGWRRMIKLCGSMDEYLEKFSGKTRRTLRYQVNKLEKAAGPGLTLRCLRSPEEVNLCFDWVTRVSKKTWQASSLALGQGADRIDRMQFWAEQGWLRAYFLVKDDEPLAFVIGRQENGLFHFAQTGFDSAWFELKAGAVLLFKMLEDLHQTDSPRWFDFGTQDMEYKERFANHSHLEARWLIFPKSLSSGLKLGSYAAYNWGLRKAREQAAAGGWLAKLRQHRTKLRRVQADAASP